MKKQMIVAGFVSLISALPSFSATLTVQQGTATTAGSLFDYSYQFLVSGAGAAVDNIYLGSNDLSPLNVVIKVDGAVTSSWSFLGNDTPQNYLQFFNIAGTSLGSGDILGVTFASSFAPAATHFAVGLASVSGNSTNTVTGVLAPNAVPAVPEPGTVVLFASALVLIMGLWHLSAARDPH